MISDFSSQYSSNRPVTSFKNCYRGTVNNEETSFSTLSNRSKGITTDRNMKESKRLFTKCIQEMNSEKKKGPEELIKGQVSEGSQATSFKALKIQMIESVLPEEKSTG
jgi:hypothetical protein